MIEQMIVLSVVEGSVDTVGGNETAAKSENIGWQLFDTSFANNTEINEHKIIKETKNQVHSNADSWFKIN